MKVEGDSMEPTLFEGDTVLVDEPGYYPLFAKLKLALFGGLFVAFPFLAYQVYAFVAPGLYKNERGAFWPYLVLAPILFTAGWLCCLIMGYAVFAAR